MIFDMLKNNELRHDSFKSTTEFLIDGFLPKQLITMIYADGGMGKSALAQAVSKKLASSNTNCFTIDLDNPMSVLESRNVSEFIDQIPNFHYISRASLDICVTELLETFNKESHGSSYKDCLFIFDSLVNFVDVHNEAKTMYVFEIFKNMREAGATILLLHHSNKDGKNYQGVNTIRNAIDCMYQLSKRPSSNDELNFLLEVKKERAGIKDRAYSVKLPNFELENMGETTARMSELEISFVTKAKKVLASTSIMQMQLLAELG
ncbi:ATPase, AAA family [Campylobacter iguaniorum]|uniref:hypothetical protein n=1 Tax=Campylobacter iguaniorum TaxID=1244531 RepID=UPI0007C8D346|nr:hypothetical protein [Campylobacter iguaniorum]ANE35691.1 ATPase, AAA family [Campylobacter iguaniorum]